MSVYDFLGDGCEPVTLVSHPGVTEKLLEIEETSFNCSKCNQRIGNRLNSSWEKYGLYGHFSKEHVPEDWIWILHCGGCMLGEGVWLFERAWPIADLLIHENQEDGIYQVTSFRGRLILFCLSQICFLQHDLSGEDKLLFLCPGHHEIASIIWHAGKAAGFYTLKPKGSPYSGSSCDAYQLMVIDVIYVRQNFRRKGLATLLLEDALKLNSENYHVDVGFSEPISNAMLQVIKKFLTTHPLWRDHLWEVSWTGGDGFRKNIWLKMKAQIRKQMIK